MLSRLAIITALYTTAYAELPGPEHRGDAEPTHELVLEAHEFEFEGYDARKRVVALRFPAELPPGPTRPRPVVVRSEGRRILLPISPELLSTALEERRTGLLQLTLVVTDAGLEGQDMDEVVPVAVRLGEGEVALAERRLDEPIVPRPGLEISVRVGPLQHEQGPAPSAPAALLEHARSAGQRCLIQVLSPEGGASLQGSLSVELHTSPLGSPERPRIVVDGLVHRPLSRCLIETLAGDEALWRGLEAGTSVYLPYYFRAGMADSPRSE